MKRLVAGTSVNGYDWRIVRYTFWLLDVQGLNDVVCRSFAMRKDDPKEGFDGVGCNLESMSCNEYDTM
jgi:hypothetical protein